MLLTILHAVAYPLLTQKSFLYKVFDSGIPVATWSKEVLSEPAFKSVINSGDGELSIHLARSFDDFGEDADVKLNNTVQLWIFDTDSPNGRMIFKGYISGYRPIIREAMEYVEVTVFSSASELTRFLLRDALGNTQIAYNSYDPANILKDAIDKYRAQGGTLNYTADSVVLTNTVVSYTFNTNTLKECLDKIIELCPVGWYYRIAPDGIIYLQPRNIVANHKFIIGKHVENLETYRRVEDLVNSVVFTGGGDPPLYKRYQNTSSQGTYGLYEKKIVDERVTVTATAEVISNRLLDDKKDPEIRSIFTIVDNNGPSSMLGYDIESVQVGQTLSVLNLATSGLSATLWDLSTWDVDVWDQILALSASDPIQILSIQYNFDSIIIEASSRLPQVAKRIEDINRNLENLQTVNNPAMPS